MNPTRVRWQILALLLGHAFFCHFNRVSLSVAGTERIIKGYDVSPTLMGFVYSSYLVVYTLCMTPGGWFIDRRGARRALLVVAFGSAACVFLIAAAGYLFASAAMLVPALIGVRAFMGAVNAPIHPAAAHAVSRWLPVERHSWANGLVCAAALLGIASTFVAFGPLMDALGWPGAFLVAGAATALWGLLWLFKAADTPKGHPGVNDEERWLIHRGRDSQPAPRNAPNTASLMNRNVVCLTLSYAALGYFQYLFFYWVQYYFDGVLKTGTVRSRWYSIVLMVSMAAGMAAGGWICDRAQLRLGRRRGRAAVAAAGLAGSAVFVVLGLLRHDPAWVVTWFSLAMASVGACEGAFWTTAAELGGARGGTAAAVMNTGGNAGGVLSPVVTPLLSQVLGWTGGIALAAVFSLLGAVLWIWIRPAEEEPAEKPVRPLQPTPV